MIGAVDFRERGRRTPAPTASTRDTNFGDELARTEAEIFLRTFLRGFPRCLRLGFETVRNFDFAFLCALMVTRLGRLLYYARKQASTQLSTILIALIINDLRIC